MQQLSVFWQVTVYAEYADGKKYCMSSSFACLLEHKESHLQCLDSGFTRIYSYFCSEDRYYDIECQLAQENDRW